MILEHLLILEDHIRDYRVQAFEQIGSNLKIYLTIRFKDNSELFIKEILIQKENMPITGRTGIKTLFADGTMPRIGRM